MTDVFNVTASYDKSQYNQGDTMTITISGGDVLTATNPTLSGTLTLTITASDGATTTISVPPTTILVTTTTPESVLLTKVVDTSSHIWTIGTSGLNATAVA